MKKYFFGLTALVSAVALVAFTNVPSSRVDYAWFDFIGSTSTEADVENLSNWRSLATRVCDNVNHEACRINMVSDAYWHNDDDGNPVLNTTGGPGGELAFWIVANLYVPGSKYYVAAVPNGSIKNKN